MDSGILESRHIAHSKVTKQMFLNAWAKRSAVKTAWRFNTRRHKLHPDWAHIMTKRIYIPTCVSYIVLHRHIDGGV